MWKSLPEIADTLKNKGVDAGAWNAMMSRADLETPIFLN